MPFDINQFSAEIARSGFARNAHYEVIITRRPRPDVNLERKIAMRASKFELPGRGILTTDDPYMGPVYKMASGVAYSDVSGQIIMSADHSEKEYFEEWLDIIAGNHRTGGITNRQAFEIGYHNDYVGSVRTIRYQDDGKKVYECELIDAWPLAVNPINLDYEDMQYTALDVQFAFRYYRTSKQNG